MVISAKSALATAIVSVAGGLGIYGLITFLSSSEPVWKSLRDDENATTNTIYSTDKYVNPYLRFLVGVANDDNNSWWNWSFNNRYQTTDGDKGEGFKAEINSWEKLKEACKKAYLSGVAVNDGNITAENVNYKEDAVWKYCSSLGEKPVTLNASAVESEAVYKTVQDSNPKWGQTSGIHDKLVSTETDSNDLFWKIQQKDLFENIDANHNFFKSKKDLGVKRACKEAYAVSKPEDSAASSDSAPIKAEILKYCSLKGQE